MKRKLIAGILIMSLGIMACACTKENPSGDNSQSQKVESQASEVTEKATEAAKGEEITAEQLTQLQETLNSVYSVAPGAAGSSLRRVVALGQLLDLSESLQGKVDAEAVVTAIKAWKGSYFVEDGMADNFVEGYSDAKSAAEKYIEDPSFFEGEKSDCGYEFQHETYSQENLKFLCDCIDEALK